MKLVSSRGRKYRRRKVDLGWGSSTDYKAVSWWTGRERQRCWKAESAGVAGDRILIEIGGGGSRCVRWLSSLSHKCQGRYGTTHWVREPRWKDQGLEGKNTRPLLNMLRLNCLWNCYPRGDIKWTVTYTDQKPKERSHWRDKFWTHLRGGG